MSNIQDMTLAMAGVCQAAKLVHQFAAEGSANNEAFESSVKSLLALTPETTLDIYGGEIRHLKVGLETLLEQFSGAKGSYDAHIGRYWISMLILEGKLHKSPNSKQLLAQRLTMVQHQSVHFELLDEQMLRNLASIYVDVISPLTAKVQVKGSPVYLQQESIHHRVRTALLCGVRSAVLWRQLGGSRLKLFFERGKYHKIATQLYSTL